MAQGSLKFWVHVSAIAVIIAGACFAEKEQASDVPAGASDLGVKLNGYAFWQFGQIIKGIYDVEPIDHQWTNNVLVGLRVSAFPSEHLHLIISPEFKLNYPYPELELGNPETKRPFGGAYINEADGIFSLGDIEKPIATATLGMFYYKYNQQCRDLGEYLFRTGTFPTYIFTDFDFPAARLLGLKLTTDAIENLHIDILLTSEAFMYPLYDFSLTGIASYKLLNAIELGGGIDFARAFPAMSGKTTPQLTRLQRPTTYNQYIGENGDTGYYSFKGTKVMLRACVDPKAFFFPDKSDLFGPEDLKIYAEIAAIGIEGYHAKYGLDSVTNTIPYIPFYNNLNNRMPRMFGFDIPAFKLLDVMALEAEYFPANIPNDYKNTLEGISPTPHVSPSTYNPDDYKAGWWRWACYAKRQILNGFSITGQVAFDHMRTAWWNGQPQYLENVAHKGDWHWEVKFGYYF